RPRNSGQVGVSGVDGRCRRAPVVRHRGTPPHRNYRYLATVVGRLPTDVRRLPPAGAIVYPCIVFPPHHRPTPSEDGSAMQHSMHWLGLSLVTGAIALLGKPQEAEAHVCMDFPVSRVGAECVARSPQKIGPCGVDGRSEIINVFRPGETIEVVLRETVDHPSHYRIAFNPDGDWFPDRK